MNITTIKLSDVNRKIKINEANILLKEESNVITGTNVFGINVPFGNYRSVYIDNKSLDCAILKYNNSAERFKLILDIPIEEASDTVKYILGIPVKINGIFFNKLNIYTNFNIEQYKLLSKEASTKYLLHSLVIPSSYNEIKKSYNQIEFEILSRETLNVYDLILAFTNNSKEHFINFLNLQIDIPQIKRLINRHFYNDYVYFDDTKDFIKNNMPDFIKYLNILPVCLLNELDLNILSNEELIQLKNSIKERMYKDYRRITDHYKIFNSQLHRIQKILKRRENGKYI